MELRHLRYFVVLAGELHFRRAAEKLHMTQPPLSQAIKELEAEIGAPLLERGRKRYVRLTAAGRTFVASARHILREAERAKQSAYIANEGGAGILTIVHTDDYLADFLPDLLYQFNLRYPGIYLDFSQDISRHYDHLNSGQLDCAFTTLPLPPMMAECSILPLPPTPIVAIVPAGHPLGRRRKATMQQIARAFEQECRFHLTGTQTAAFDAKLARLLTRAGLRIRATLAPGSSSIEMEMVRRGYGVTFATEGSIPSRINRLKVIRLDDPDAYLERALVWRADNTNPTLARFLEMVHERNVPGSAASRPR